MVLTTPPRTEKACMLISSIYEICIHGNGSVNERDRTLAKYKLKPSYMSAKWFHFNHFGLNKMKVENALVMFGAKSSGIVVDVLSLPLAASIGVAKLKMISIAIDASKLVFVSASKLVLQEVLERKFNNQMFNGKLPRFQSESENFEELILNKHEINFSHLSGYLQVLKQFGALPMLNYIFFHYQMTEEYIDYRKKYLNKNNLQFKTIEAAEQYFKTLFRMMRFCYYIEIHALNYFFSSTYSQILNFYINSETIRNKLSHTFGHDNPHTALNDAEQFIQLLNHHIQLKNGVSIVRWDVLPDTIEQFQNLYSEFFFNQTESYEKQIALLQTPKIQRYLNEHFTEDIKNKIFYIFAKNFTFDRTTEAIQKEVLTPLTSHVKTGFEYLLNILTNFSSRSARDKGIVIGAAIGITTLIGSIVGGAIAGYKHSDTVAKLATRFYNNIVLPPYNYIKSLEEKLINTFAGNEVAIPSSVNKMLGSILFVASHIPGLSTCTSIFNYMSQIVSYNPVSTLILKTATKFTSTRLEKKDLSILHQVDQYMRLGYAESGDLCVKIFNKANMWIEEFDIDLITDDFLRMLTNDFARVVRHQVQSVGVLFEQISLLDEEIKNFQTGLLDILYCGRVNNVPQFAPPMVKIDPQYATPEQTTLNSKRKFFDILIERQNLLVCLINRSYYVTLYNLMMEKIKTKCQNIFDEDLSRAIANLDNQVAAGIM